MKSSSFFIKIAFFFLIKSCSFFIQSVFFDADLHSSVWFHPVEFECQIYSIMYPHLWTILPPLPFIERWILVERNPIVPMPSIMNAIENIFKTHVFNSHSYARQHLFSNWC
eukprot:209413_1